MTELIWDGTYDDKGRKVARFLPRPAAKRRRVPLVTIDSRMIVSAKQGQRTPVRRRAALNPHTGTHDRGETREP